MADATRQFVPLLQPLAVPERRFEIHASRGEVHAPCGEVHVSCDKVQASCGEVQASCDKVQASCDEVQASCDEVHASCDEVHASCDEVHASCGAVHAPCDTVLAPCGTVHAPCGEVSLCSFEPPCLLKRTGLGIGRSAEEMRQEENKVVRWTAVEDELRDAQGVAAANLVRRLLSRRDGGVPRAIAPTTRGRLQGAMADATRLRG